MKSHNMRTLAILSATAALLLASVGGGFAAAPLKMDFVTHAAFFSGESKQPKVLDPQVFIHDAAAQAATGPQGNKARGRLAASAGRSGCEVRYALQCGRQAARIRSADMAISFRKRHDHRTRRKAVAGGKLQESKAERAL
ncbi:hypothetical protein ACVWXO_007402 [Bradyrhizobium sp. LM2.7]